MITAPKAEYDPAEHRLHTEAAVAPADVLV